MKLRVRALVLAALLVPLLAGPVAAGEARGVAVVGSSYWHSFLEYWEGAIMRQNGIVMAVLGVGAVALFIITRGKWQK